MSGYNQVFRKNRRSRKNKEVKRKRKRKGEREGEGEREKERIFSLGRYLSRADVNKVLKMFMEIWTYCLFYFLLKYS